MTEKEVLELFPGFKLRFDEGHEGASRLERGDGGRQHLGQRDKGHVDGHQIDWPAKIGCREIAGVDAVVNHDPWILPQFPIQLAFAHVDRVHARGATLQKAIGEPARRSAEVGANEAVAGDVERRERGFELMASAAGVFLRRLDDEGGVIANQVAGFVGELSVDTHGACKNQSFRLFAAFREAAGDELGVKTVAHR